MRALGLFVCLATLLPFSRAQRWWVRLFDFPRLQVSALGAAVIAAGAFRKRQLSRFDRTLDSAVKLATAVQLLQIYRYTPLARKEVCRESNHHPASRITILIANVLMTNRHSRPLLDLIRHRQPDLVLLLEPDDWWDQQLKILHQPYEYSVRFPLNNTYGILLYSRLPLVNPEIRFVVQADVPSVRTRVRLRSGQTVWFYGMHPKPPGRETRRGGIRGSKRRDAELIRIAYEVQTHAEPTLVTGDFNDVAWSYTTRLFQRISRLLDPRVGRGFYNTFHANHPLCRFPLDHLFHSEHFGLVDFERLPYIGSDHFPIYASLCLAPDAPLKQEAEPASESDLEEAAERVKLH